MKCVAGPTDLTRLASNEGANVTYGWQRLDGGHEHSGYPPNPECSLLTRAQQWLLLSVVKGAKIE
jgi:hypothetical protein